MTAVVSVSGWDIVACSSSSSSSSLPLFRFFARTPRHHRSAGSGGTEQKQKVLTNSRTLRTVTGKGER